MHKEEYVKTGRINTGIRTFWMPNWIWNAAENKSFVEELYHERGDKIDLRSMPRPPVGPKGERIPCLILGSGPSFERALPHLRFWRGAIFATPSHCKVLDVWKRHPDYILALDTSTRVPDQFEDVEFHGTNLITHPSMCHGLFEKWKWRDHMFLFRMYEPENEILNAVYDSLFPFIQSKIINSGCVANNAIIIANNLGYSPIFLVGVDFGYPTPRMIWSPEELYEEARPKKMPGETDDTYALRLNDWKVIDDDYKKDREKIYALKGIYKHQIAKGMLRFRDYVEIGKFVYEPKPIEWSTNNSPEDYKQAEMPDGSICLTTPTNLFYRTTLMANWKMMHYPIVNCSYGLLKATDIPFCTIEEAVRKQGQDMASKEGDPYYMSWEQIDKAADDFTVPRGLYAKYGFVNKQPVIRGIEIVDTIQTETVEVTHRLNMLKTLGDLWSQDKEGNWQRQTRPEDSPNYMPPDWKEALEQEGVEIKNEKREISVSCEPEKMVVESVATEKKNSEGL